MTHKKHVTDAVRAANRSNCQHSTGPSSEQGKSHSSRNALRHGLLARKLEVEDDKERVALQKLRGRCESLFGPKHVIEKFFVEEIAMIIWKLGIAEGLEVRELLRRQELSDGVDGILGNHFGKDLELPIYDGELPLDRGWDCERLVVRGFAGKDQRHSRNTGGPGIVEGKAVPATKTSHNSDNQEGNQLVMEAALVSALESMTRYKAKLKRDLYRAIDMLRKIQSERREGEE
jgi:hypothetical protein